MPTTRPRTTRPSALATLVPTLALGVVLSAALGACSADDTGGGDGPDGGSTRAAAGREAPEVVRTVVVPGQRVGRLSPRQHQQVARRVASVVDGWWDAAFVEADYPRADRGDQSYRGSFPGFTGPAAAQAWRQRDLMTSARLGERIDDLVPLRRRVAVDVLATRQVPRAATARVRMDYRASGPGELEKRIRVQGRLLLTYDRGWKVFGFDVTQGPWTPAPPQQGRKK